MARVAPFALCDFLEPKRFVVFVFVFVFFVSVFVVAWIMC
jgi:hypothetical protein